MEFKINLNKNAANVSGFFLFCLFTDYYGGFGLKYIGYFIAFTWVLLNKKSLVVFLKRQFDFLMLIYIPIIIILFHLFLDLFKLNTNLDLSHYAGRSFALISSPLLLFLFPLFKYVGTGTLIRQIRFGFRLVAISVIILFSLNAANIIDINQFTDIGYKYKIGLFGVDVRLADTIADYSQKTVIIPFIAYPMVFVLGYEIVGSIFYTCLLLLSLILIGERGILFGAILIIILYYFFINFINSKRNIKRLILVLFVLVSIIFLSENVRFRVTEVFVNRSVQLFNLEDESTLIRVGHLTGYRNLIESNPINLIIGSGPVATIYNPLTQSMHEKTEMSALNTLINFGLIYLILYIFVLYRSCFNLFSKRRLAKFNSSDLGLLIGVGVFWLIGNTNPLINSPFSIIAYMLLRIRSSEIARVD